MQKFIIVEGFVGKLACVKVISENKIIVDIALKDSPTYQRDLAEIIRKYNID